MTVNGTSAMSERPAFAGASARPDRVDWVDYAKGICIVMVVMMHSVLGVEAAAGQTGFMHLVRDVRQTVPDAGFLPDFRTFPLGRDRPRLAHLYLDRKVVHFAYFYLLWVTIQFGFKAPVVCRRNQLAPRQVYLYLESFIEPFGTLWFIYLLPIFFVVTKLSRRIPPAAIWLVAAALEMTHVATGWTVIDEFCARFVYFYSGYCVCRLHVCAVGSRTGAACVRSRRAGAMGARQWRSWSRQVSASGRWFRWRWGLAGACAIIVIGTLLARAAPAQLPALLRRAFHRHLSRLLPADGGDPHAAATRRSDSRHRRDFADRDHRRRRRCTGDLAAGAGTARQLPVRPPRCVLDCAEEGGTGIAAGGVVFHSRFAVTPVCIRVKNRPPRLSFPSKNP